MLGATQLGSCSAGKNLDPGGTRLRRSQECDLPADGMGCIRKSIVSRSREVILPLCSALMKPHLECCVQFWSPQYRTDTDILQRVPQRGHKDDEPEIFHK